MKTQYEDIINLPRHVSVSRPQMPLENRAAQFSPFAALTGYDAAVMETSRQTEQKIELGESTVAELDMKLNMLADTIDSKPEVAITHFVPDAKKDGGSYVTTAGAVKKIDGYEQAVVMVGGEKIGITNILDIKSQIFNELF